MLRQSNEGIILNTMIFLPILSMIGFIGCGSKSKKAVPKEILGRSGSQVESTSFQFVDRDPVISASGDRILYISGRESSEEQIRLKVFRIDWPLSQAPKETQRLTNTDLGQEQEVSLSPDGNYAVIGALKNMQKDLYLQPIAPDTEVLKSPIPLTQNKDYDNNGEFTHDSKYFAWVARVGTKSEIRMVSVSQVVQKPDALSENIRVGEAFDGQAYLTWIPTNEGAPYRLVIAKSKVGSLFTLEEGQFTDPNNVSLKSIALPKPLDQGIILKKGIKITANKKNLFLVQDMSGATQESIERVGDAPALENGAKEKSAVFSKLLAFDHASFTTVTLQDGTQEPHGIETLGSAWNLEGQFGLILNRSYFRCQEDPKPAFGTGILWAELSSSSPSNSAVYKRKTVRFSGIQGQPMTGRQPVDPDSDGLLENWIFTLKDGFCDRRLDGEMLQQIDNQINTLSLNSSATQGQFRMVYSSRFVPRVDSKCELKAGDLEVRAMEWKENQATFHSLTPNRAVLKNASPLEVPCRVYW